MHRARCGAGAKVGLTTTLAPPGREQHGCAHERRSARLVLICNMRTKIIQNEASHRAQCQAQCAAANTIKIHANGATWRVLEGRPPVMSHTRGRRGPERHSRAHNQRALRRTWCETCSRHCIATNIIQNGAACALWRVREGRRAVMSLPEFDGAANDTGHWHNRPLWRTTQCAHDLRKCSASNISQHSAA